MKFVKAFLLIITPVLFLFSCKKWEDQKAQNDPRIDARKYCNDPLAVNYNWDFPGQADNSVCIYPTDLFKGNYLFKDSIYNSDMVFDSARSQTIYPLQLIALDKNKFRIVGFCATTDSLKFTAERSTYRANADSTIKLNDTTVAYGQFFCSSLDTLSGYLLKDRNDSSKLYIEFSVVSDTGLNFHRGTAIKQ